MRRISTNYWRVSGSFCLKTGLFSGLFVLLSLAGWAQDRTISGTVTGDGSGEPLPGVNVIVKGTTQGTVTDIEGNYRLNAPEDAETLTFSFIGMTSKEVAIDNQSDISITMAEDSKQLSEVVVTALNIPREKRSLGYSVQQIDGEELSNIKNNNVVNSLSGKIAGVSVNGAPGGGLGTSAQILIRGVSSITGDNRPLYVVDGTPIDNSNFNTDDTQNAGGGVDYGDAIADINANDIESMTVLKGANAAALYGSRAANGVILITTKSGKGKNGIGIDINSGMEVNTAAVFPNYQNEYGGGYKQEFDLYEGQPVVNYAADESWGPRMEGQLVREWFSWYEDDPQFGQLTPFSPNSSNIRDFYETGLTFNNSVALYGGNEKTNFRLSYTNYQGKGTVPNNELDKNTIALNASSALTDKLTVSARVNYANFAQTGIPTTGYSADLGNTNNSTSFNQWFQRQIDMDRLRNYQTPTGGQRTWNIKSPTDLNPLYWDNPFFGIYESPINNFRERVFGDVSLRYEFTDNLSIQGWARTDFYTDRREQRLAVGSLQTAYYLEDIREVRDNNYELHLTYNKDFSTDFSLNLLAGANLRQRRLFRNYAQTEGGLSVPGLYTVNASIDRPTIDDERAEKEVQSLFGSASIGYKGIAYLDATIRSDWSSVFPEENNNYLYPAVTGTFVFSELLGDQNLFSLGKIRASWSSIYRDTDPNQILNTYSIQDAYGSSPAYAAPNVLNNPNLRPELSITKEFGVEMSFFQNRVGFDVTYYDISTTDQIIELDVSATSGAQAAVINAGELTNKGWEVMLRGTPVQTAGGFSWDVSVNWARNVNRVESLYQDLDAIVLASWGPSINAKVGQSYGTWITDGFTYNDQGQRLVDEDGFYVRSTNQTFGSYLPDWVGGVTNTFRYRGLSLSATIDVREGGQLYSVTNRYGTYSGLLEETVGLNTLGNPKRDPVSEGGGVIAQGVVNTGTEEAPNYEANTQAIDAQQYYKALRSYRENYLYDASFVKLREVRLAYSLPNSIIANTPFTGITVSAYGRNLAILSKNVPNVDPETANGSGNVQGFENGQYPSTRTVGFNVNIKL